MNTIKKIKLIVYLFILSTFYLNAQDKFSFEDLGYPKESVIVGNKSEKTFYINASETINANKSSIHLELKTSQVIDVDKSYITVFLAGIPVETKFVNKKNTVEVFDIPLSKEYIQSGFFKLTIKTNLAIGDESCDNYSPTGYWVKINSNSYASLKSAINLKTIVYKYISDLSPNVSQIVLSNQAGIDEMKLASYIKFYFKRIYGTEINVISMDEALENVIDRSILLIPDGIVNTRFKINYDLTKLDKNNGFVGLCRDIYKDDKQKIGQNILVTAKNIQSFEKACSFLLQKNIINSCFSEYTIVKEVAPLLDTPQRKDYEPIYFDDLGADTRLIKGIGSLPKEISLPRSFFGSNVKKMMVRISGKYRPIGKEEKAYFNLFFNNKLLNTYMLNSSGELDVNFEFSNINMKQENSFRYEYYHVPPGGICNADALFYAQIDTKASYFKPVGYEVSSSLSFSRFPENFQSKPINIYTDLTYNKNIVNAFAEIVDILNPGEAGLEGFVYPKIKKINIKAIRKDKRSSKIIISNKIKELTEAYREECFLKLDNRGIRYKSEKADPFFNLVYSDKMGFNQMFYAKDGNPTMMILIPEGSADKTIVSLVSTIREQSLTDSGNVIVANDEKSYFFDLRSDEKENSKGALDALFKDFWSKYGLIIVLLLAISVGFLLYYIYKKSQESKKNILDE